MRVRLRVRVRTRSRGRSRVGARVRVRVGVGVRVRVSERAAARLAFGVARVGLWAGCGLLALRGEGRTRRVGARALERRERRVVRLS